MESISEQRFFQLLADERQLANRRAKEWGLVNEDGRWFYQDVEFDDTFHGDDDAPCVYREEHEPDNTHFTCPTTRERLATRPLPKTFQSKARPKVQRLFHAADVTCAAMNMNTKVRCYAHSADGFFQTEHKVGRCPFKERRR